MINSCPDNASSNGPRSRPASGSISSSPATVLIWMRQTFSGYACKLSASVSTATQLAALSIGRNSASLCSVAITAQVYCPAQKRPLIFPCLRRRSITRPQHSHSCPEQPPYREDGSESGLIHHLGVAAGRISPLRPSHSTIQLSHCPSPKFSCSISALFNKMNLIRSFDISLAQHIH